MLSEFLKISHYAGQREDLIQAGGGNSSVKLDSSKMLIKSSGYQLADLSEEQGYSTVDYQVMRNFFAQATDASISQKAEREVLEQCHLGGEKPSIETFLHSITGRFTLHTHPLVVNVLTSRSKGMEILHHLFPDALFIDYAKPGIELAWKYYTAAQSMANETHPLFDIIFFKNHGLMVSGPIADDVIQKTEQVTAKIESYLKMDLSAYHYMTVLWTEYGRLGHKDVFWKVTDGNILDAMRSFGINLWNHSFCPDCVIYCGKKILRLIADRNVEEQFREYERKWGKPVVVFAQGNLYIIASSVKKALEIQSVLSFSAQVCMMNKKYKMDFLCEEEQDLLLNWDSEKYRQSLK